MFIVSSRRKFTSNYFVAKSIQYRFYPDTDDLNAHKRISLAALQAEATNKRVCILVHGYNNDFPAVMEAYGALHASMQTSGVPGESGYGLVIGFAWPGRASGAGYFTARGAARRAAPHLRKLINDLRSVAHRVDIQTHSLGARVALTALNSPRTVFVDHLFLTAPAVDHHTLEPGRTFHSALDGCNRCLVYHSKKDRVLRVAYPAGDFADGLRKALGLYGPRSRRITLEHCLNVYVIDCAHHVGTHGGYRGADAYRAHWRRVLSGDALERYSEL